MSDPVSNADIEDVLSSIRRLVSEEPIAPSARRAPKPEPEVDRFVLTPAFRVVEAKEPAEPEIAEDTDVAVKNSVVEAAEELHQDQPVTDAVTASTPVDELDSLISSAFESDANWSESEQEPEANVVADEAQSATEITPALEALLDKEPAANLADLTLEQRIAELEAALEMSPQEWEPDGSEDGDSDETRPLSVDAADDRDKLAAAINHDDAETAEAPEIDVLAADAMPTEAYVLAEVADALEQQEAEPAVAFAPEGAATDVEADEAEQVAEWLDVEVEDDGETDTAEVSPDDSNDAAEALRGWQEAAIEEPLADIKEQPVDASEQAAAAVADPGEEQENFLADDETTIDEDALREIVGDLVRQELQGVLGERITRNVRRLVRREIQRAMAMRDLE